ncbi:MAG: 3-isopropylmalate dehydratase, partial [Candidatus Omnitrophica bacterium]|nr:3-isopropylmalate dehydratase [Candidatus Omnitrophota bacterium]
GDSLEVDTDKGHVLNKSKNKKSEINPLPEFMAKIIKDGGVVKHFKKYGGFKI